MEKRFKVTIILIISLIFYNLVSAQNRQVIPVAGNAFLTKATEGAPDRVGRQGIQNWQSPGAVFSVWFHANKACKADISLQAERMDGKSALKLTAGKKSFKVNLHEGGKEEFKVGRIRLEKAGYVRIDLQGIHRSGPEYAVPVNLVLTTADTAVRFSYVRDNEQNRFYWGRRGPSVHLSYTSPIDKDLEWFYSEITVPEGEDVVGSYFMANGFAEGYFGMQVNSETERRVIFSVWSPFVTDNPEEIPETDRIKVVRKGEQTIAHDFGNEGSGGHSRIVFPWKAGKPTVSSTGSCPTAKGIRYIQPGFLPRKGPMAIHHFIPPAKNRYLAEKTAFLP
jgi:hypothetical protein